MCCNSLKSIFIFQSLKIHYAEISVNSPTNIAFGFDSDKKFASVCKTLISYCVSVIIFSMNVNKYKCKYLHHSASIMLYKSNFSIDCVRVLYFLMPVHKMCTSYQFQLFVLQINSAIFKFQQN